MYSYRDMKSDYQNLIPFIPESKQVEDKSEIQKLINPSCSGQEIKTFYENLTKDESNFGKRKCSVKKKTVTNNHPHKPKQKSPCNNIQHTACDPVTKETKELFSNRAQDQMLKFAQTGDLISLRLAAEKGLDMNYQDTFGWTALMCAAVEGHLEVIEYLLQIGADIYLKNSKNETARDLATSVKKSVIVKVIDNHWNSNNNPEERPNSFQKETFFCEICKSEFSEFVKHQTSTAHLFNRQIKPQDPHFTIPESNKGFQLMVKHGWNKGQGLGSQGQGQRYPVKTVLKRDRHGLGAVIKQTSRITHFTANDQRSVDRVKKNSERKVSARTLSKHEMQRRERRNKKWERNMRQYFNTD